LNDFDAAPFPEDESERQRAVDATHITTRGADAELQRIVEDAAETAGAPIAAITIIDRDRQWFAARVGLANPEGPRSESFCAYAILKPGEPMVVADASQDKRFAGNPAVTGDPRIRFYAGVPLVDTGGYAVGALCIADTRPRHEPPDLFYLAYLARLAERIISN
jgi:GAF domain-containing protein